MQSSTTLRASFKPLYGPIALTVLPWTSIYVFVSNSRAFRVDPFGPRILCRRFANLSLFRTRFRILMMSQAVSSSKIFMACGAGTLRASRSMQSLALRMAAGSYVFRVVVTLIRPWTRSSVQLMPRLSKVFVTIGHACFRYSSRYLGNNVAKEDSSEKVPPALSSGLNSSICEGRQCCAHSPATLVLTFHLSISSVSHGFSFLCVDGIL